MIYCKIIFYSKVRLKKFNYVELKNIINYAPIILNNFIYFKIIIITILK